MLCVLGSLSLTGPRAQRGRVEGTAPSTGGESYCSNQMENWSCGDSQGVGPQAFCPVDMDIFFFPDGFLAADNAQCMLCVQWERYMRCDGAPDPAVQKEMNTYMCLWRDDPEVNITLVLQQCNLALQVCMCLLINDQGYFISLLTDNNQQQFSLC